MKNRITISTIVLLLIYSFMSFAQTIKWEDRMNGDNSVAGLQARGWIVLNEDGGGDLPPWFQGESSIFLLSKVRIQDMLLQILREQIQMI